MIDELNTISTHPKVYLMVPPPLYVDGIGASPNVLLHTAWLRYM